MLNMKLSCSIWRVMLLILLVAIVEQLATDCYLPAFPDIAKSFATTNSLVQLTLSLFLLGEALAQPFFGFLSDAYGRRPMLILGISIFSLGSIISLLVPEIHYLLVSRLVQGFGAGSSIVLARSIAKDLFPTDIRFSKMVSAFGTLLILLQLMSPVVGGYIQHHWGWYYIFLLIALLAVLLTFIIIAWLPETFVKEQRGSFHLAVIFKSYRVIILSKIFWLNMLCASLATSISIIYITITPFLYQHVLQVSVVAFGWLTASVSLGLAFGNIINFKLVEKIGLNGMLKLGAGLMLIAIVTMLLIGLLGVLNLWVILLPMLLAVIGVGFISANAAANALSPFPQLVGGASAIYGAVQFLTFSLSSAGAALVHAQTQVPLALLMLVPIVIIVVTMLFLPNIRNRNKEG